MIYLEVKTIEHQTGAVENVNRPYMIPVSLITDAFEDGGKLIVRTQDGRRFECRGCLDSIVGQLEAQDYTGQIVDLMAALDGVGDVLGKALYKFQEYRSEDLTRPVC
tara:strand:+ start:108 stop:428 length:321 start_codon:yes stop_codon:yes gene_type:complete